MIVRVNKTVTFLHDSKEYTVEEGKLNDHLSEEVVKHYMQHINGPEMTIVDVDTLTEAAPKEETSVDDPTTMNWHELRRYAGDRGINTLKKTKAEILAELEEIK